MPPSAPPRRLRSILGHGFLRATGWRATGELDPGRKAVLVAAPHTSNWDFLYMLAISSALDFPVHWIGKHTLFEGPLGGLLRRLGGISVDRRASHNAVEQVVAAFRNQSEFVLVIAPEGTRGRGKHWKTGFYYMALGAGVPMQLGFVDYKRKACGLGPVLVPSGDLAADMAVMRAFYRDVQGKFPENATPVELAEAKAAV